MTDDANYMSRSELLKAGFTAGLILKFFPKPDMSRPVKRGHLFLRRNYYLRSKVEAATRTPEFQATALRRQVRAEAPQRRREEFAARYGDWRGAVPVACHYMHSLNRFAKHRACSFESRGEIYALKNRFVEALYVGGYCTACWIHTQVLPAKPCRECGGTGYGGECDRCDGSGVYLPAKAVSFYVFRFAVGRGYTWHQPDSLVKFPVETTREPEQWAGAERDKPLLVPASKFGAAKELIRWVLAGSTGAPQESPLPPPEWRTAAPVAVDWMQDGLF